MTKNATSDRVTALIQLLQRAIAWVALLLSVLLSIGYVYLRSDISDESLFYIFKSLLLELLVGIIPVGMTVALSYAIFKNILDIKAEHMLDSMLEKFGADQSDKQSKFIKKLNDAIEIRSGLVGVYEDLPGPRIREAMEKSRRILVLQTWTHVFDAYRRALSHAIRDSGAELRVLLLHPESEFAEQRAKDQHISERNFANPEFGKERIELAKASLLAISKTCGEGSANINLRYYRRLPSVAAYLCDDQAFVGFFLKDKRAVDYPCLELLGTKNLLRQAIENEFEILWEESEGVIENGVEVSRSE